MSRSEVEETAAIRSSGRKVFSPIRPHSIKVNQLPSVGPTFTKSASTSSEYHHPASTNLAPVNGNPTLVTLERTSSRSALNKSTVFNHYKLGLQRLEVQFTSTVNSIFAAIRKPDILARTKKLRDSRAQVNRAFKTIQRIYQGNPENDDLLIKKSLTSCEYDKLLGRIARSKSLQRFFNNKLR
jgi:hypothetical protein